MAAPRCIRSTGFALALAVIAVAVPLRASAQCIADNTINSFFETEVVGGPIPQPGSCCQSDVCGIPCPAEQDPPTKGFGIAVGVAIGAPLPRCFAFCSRGCSEKLARTCSATSEHASS